MNTMNRREIPGTSALAAYPLATGADIEEGDIVCLDAAGQAVEGSDTAGLTVAGIAVNVDADANTVEVRDGIVGLALPDDNAPTRADRGKPVYVTGVDEVATDSTNKICAGVLVDVYDGEAFVDIRPGYTAAVAAGTAAGAVAGSSAGTTAGATAGAAAVTTGLAGGGVIALAIAAAIAGAGNVRLVTAPVAANSAGVAGDLAIDETAIYLCTATNTWLKASLAFATWVA